MDRNSSRYLSASDYDDQPVAQGYDNEQSVSRHGSRDIENQPPQPVLFLSKFTFISLY